MKRKLAAILALLLLVCTPAMASTEEQQDDAFAARKVERGMPYIGGWYANVSVNGCYLTTGIGNAKPLYVGPRMIALPLRGFLWNAGARPRVYYRDNHLNYHMPNGSDIEIQNGSPDLIITKDGTTRTVEMDSHTMATYGDEYALDCYVKEMLGYGSAFDEEYGAVHFTDWTKIAAQLDEDLVCLGEILSAAAQAPVSAGTRFLGDYPLQTDATDGVPPVRRMYRESLFARALLGDNAFTTRESGKSKTYTSQGDAVRLAVWLAAAQKADNSLKLNKDPFEVLPERLPDIRYTLTFRTYDGDLRQARLSGSVKPVGGQTETFSVDFMRQEGDLLTNICAAMPFAEWMPMLAEFGGEGRSNN